MADTKISALPAVTDVIGTDEYVLARSGASKKITAADLLVADTVSFTPAGTISSTDVQGAIEEVAAEAGATSALTQIYDNLLVAAAANFDITSIPGSYNHLWLILYLRGTKSATSVQPRLTFNNDTGTNYDSQKQYASAGTGGAGGTIGQAYIDLTDASAASSDTGAVSAIEALIPQYAGTTFHKTVTGKGFNPRAYSSGNEYVMNTGGLWKNTAAITRITVTPDSNNWDAGSRATLYGML